ncbi:uncharacterized protein [Palaemon carinicauda]|uniref:uncharacterized protein n=1 Tax=Palaemon carinicauda TaxID=392227 RepID=UPI0035B57158
MAERILTFRELLKPDKAFTVTDDLEGAIQASKEAIVDEITKGVRIFNKTKQTCLATDWSKESIGFWLFQKHCQCPEVKPFYCRDGWKVILVGSRFMHPAESRYAVIEGEALAVADALDKSRYFVLSCSNLVIEVDHKPLLKVLGNQSLDDIPNPHLLNLKEKTLCYRFCIVYGPGMRNKAADAISRHPRGNTNPEKLYLPDDNASVCDYSISSAHHDILASICMRDCDTCMIEEPAHLTALNSLTEVTWERVRESTASDPVLHALTELIEHGFSTSQDDMPQHLRAYYHLQNELITFDGVALFKDRVIVSTCLRQGVLFA